MCIRDSISYSAANVTGTVAVGNGGTGATTLSGVVYGNGTSAFTAATGSQIATAIGSTAVTNATTASNANNLGGNAPSYYQPASSAITTSNIGSQSVSYATTAGNGGVTSVNTTTGAVVLSYLSDFNRSLGTTNNSSGYQYHPGGLIIQWGYSSSWAAVTFPIAFPNHAFSVTGTPTTNQEFFIVSGSLTTTGFTPGTNGNTSPFYWVAFGN